MKTIYVIGISTLLTSTCFAIDYQDKRNPKKEFIWTMTSVEVVSWPLKYIDRLSPTGQFSWKYPERLPAGHGQMTLKYVDSRDPLKEF